MFKAEVIAASRNVVKIYVLKDPYTLNVRYIGKTQFTLERRLQFHLSCAKIQARTYVHKWINSLEHSPIIELLYETNQENWAFWETFFIEEYREMGYKLCNLTTGGEGQPGYKHTEETKKKMSIAVIARGAIPPSKLGIHMSQETKNKIKNAQIGKSLSEEHKLALKKGQIGVSHPKAFIKVIETDLNGNFITLHESVTAAAKSIKRTTGDICRAIKTNGRVKQSKYKYYVQS